MSSSSSRWYADKLETILNTTIDRSSRMLIEEVEATLHYADLTEDQHAREHCHTVQLRLARRLQRFQELWKRNVEILLSSSKNSRRENKDDDDREDQKMKLAVDAAMHEIGSKDSIFEWSKKDPLMKLALQKIAAKAKESKLLSSVAATATTNTNSKINTVSSSSGTMTIDTQIQRLHSSSFPLDLFSSIPLTYKNVPKWNTRRRESALPSSSSVLDRKARSSNDILLEESHRIEDEKIKSGELEIANDGTIAALLRFDDDDDENEDLDAYIEDGVSAFDADGIGKIDQWLQEFHKKHFVDNQDDADNNEKPLKIIHLNGTAWGSEHGKGILEDSVRYSFSGRDASVFSAGHCFVKFPAPGGKKGDDNDDDALLLLERKAEDQEIFARFDLMIPFLDKRFERGE